MLNNRKEVAEQLYQEMRGRGLCPDSYARSALISMYGATSEVSRKRVQVLPWCRSGGSACFLDLWPAYLKFQAPMHRQRLPVHTLHVPRPTACVWSLHVRVQILESCICVWYSRMLRGALQACTCIIGDLWGPCSCKGLQLSSSASDCA